MASLLPSTLDPSALTHLGPHQVQTCAFARITHMTALRSDVPLNPQAIHKLSLPHSSRLGLSSEHEIRFCRRWCYEVMTQGCTETKLEELDKMADFLERRVPLRQVQMLKHAIALQQHDHEAGVQALHRYFDSPASEDLHQC